MKKALAILSIVTVVGGASSAVSAQGFSNSGGASYANEASEATPSNGGVAPAANGRVEWRGGAVFTWLSQACLDAGWALDGYPMAIRYRPSWLGTNGSTSGFGLYFSSFAFGVRVPGRIVSTWKTYEGYGISGGGWGPSSGYVRFSSISPADFSESTPSIDVEAVMTNMGGDDGCNAVLRGVMYKRP